MIIMSHEGRVTYCFLFMSLVPRRFSVVNFGTCLAFFLDPEPQNQFQPKNLSQQSAIYGLLNSWKYSVQYIKVLLCLFHLLHVACLPVCHFCHTGCWYGFNNCWNLSWLWAFRNFLHIYEHFSYFNMGRIPRGKK